jgi:hypothetical protein
MWMYLKPVVLAFLFIVVWLVASIFFGKKRLYS